MQLIELVQVANARWSGLFGGLAGLIAALLVMTLPVSQPQEALLVGLLTGVFSLLLMVVTNLTGLMPANTRSDETASND
ncbi:hypothetical protein EGH24_05350 [Halonotius terrestris]|uniref:Uncharacterized protein n=1 Tax=Halonotius terrestris TaxID=2487750 RepID=A0A8J8PCW4_9EURY|nr:hypothetical protein [Halonotius terrestris]TQQ82867.1 hypothetical protein EGH24_05350 [Halonotius terrestris]